MVLLSGDLAGLFLERVEAVFLGKYDESGHNSAWERALPEGKIKRLH
jgi:hypothetical protein